MNKKQLAWLLNEIETLNKKGFINSDSFSDIQNYYKDSRQPEDNKVRILTIFGVLGGLLIGGGIILLLAHNWSSFNRVVQVAFFLVPLIVVQSITAVFLMSKEIRHIWFETIGIIYFLLIGAAVAMVSRIYHIGGDLETFLLVWAVGGLPILYFLKSDTASIIYLAVITAWAAVAQENGGSALIYWPLFAAVAYKLVLSIRNSRSGYYKAFLEFLLILSLTASMGLTLEKVLPGLWILIYCCFFVMLFLSEGFFKTEAAGLSAPGLSAPGLSAPGLSAPGLSGLIGIIAMAVLLTVDGFWENVGFRFLRDANRFHQAQASVDYIILGALVLLVLLLILSRRVKINSVNLMFSSILIPAAAGFLLPAYGAVIFQVFTILLGFTLTVKEIVRDKHKFHADTGLLIIFISLLLNLAVYDGFSVHLIFLYSCFFIVAFIRSGLFSGSIGFGVDRFWRVVCFFGGILLLYGLSFTSYDISSFPEEGKFLAAYLISMIIAGISAFWHLIPFFKKNRRTAMLLSVFPVIVLLSIFPIITGTLFYNLYLFTIGITMVLKGVSGKSMTTANSGIIITIALIITRFFDVDMSFTARGAAFILIGLLFVLFNVYFSRRIKKDVTK